MMKIINKVTLRHMLLNKKRTLVTIIGVIISVAMITAVSTFAASMFDFMQRMEMQDSGNWHVSYLGTKVSSLSAIAEDDGTKEMYVTREDGYAKLPQANQKEKPYLYLQSYDTNAFSHNFIELVEGRFPQADSEIVLPQSLLEKSGNNWKIGDVISLEIGQREVPIEVESGITEYVSVGQTMGYSEDERLKNTEQHTYTVVGIIDSSSKEASWSPGYMAYTYLDTSKLSGDETVDAYLTVSKLDRSLYNRAEDLQTRLQASGDTGATMRYHTSLLAYYGCSDNNGFITAMYSIATILILIIMIGSISLIYNAFAISISERSKQFGMLTSVGATRKQKRDSVFFEGGVIGLISIPIGVAAGLGGAAGVFYFVNQLVIKFWAESFNLTFRVILSLPAIAAAVVFSVLTIFISAYLPARKASKITPIEAIRQSTEIKLTSKQVKTSKLTRKIFGFEAELGLKNLKRNKKRYRATVFSLIISILLFLSVSYFTDALTGAYTMTQTNVNFDRSLTCRGYTLEEIAPVLDKISKVEGTDQWAVIKSLNTEAFVPENALSQKTKTIVENEESEGQIYSREGERMLFGGDVNSMNEEYLKAFCKANGIDYDKINDPQHPTALFLNSLQAQSGGIYYEGTVLQSGTYSITLRDIYEVETTMDMTVITLDNAVPIGFNPVSNPNVGANLVVGDRVFEKLLETLGQGSNGEYSIQFVSTLTPEYQNNESLMAQYDNSIQSILDGDTSRSGLYYTNLTQARQQQNTLAIILNIFVYGFIALITAICVANVFNTISTSISVRRREFAMLRSVGMTPKSFNRMIRYESIFYGIKALLYGIPISIAVMWMMHGALAEMFQPAFVLPWVNILIAVLSVFLIVGISMLYSSSKVKKANIIDALKDETI
ncbi:MAG TPA: FtsX-like permease family protein [Firmicutes bacterium]|nr:FtsX-like permease family protein [Bacillota bacterium]